MANLKNITGAFLDGFGSLASVFGPVQRPGSFKNLISAAPSPASSLRFAQNLTDDGAELHAIAARLRRSADLLDSFGNVGHNGLALQHAARADARTAHGAR